MTAEQWWMSDNVRAARADMLAAHARFRAVEPLGASHAEFASAKSDAMRAETAYFRLFPAGHLNVDDQWDPFDAETSRMEGFTAGDTDD